MDDMNAFERLVAGEVMRAAEPVRPVDDLALYSTVNDIATRSPKWRFQSMFSATRFVVAGALVALFGGFLLAGVLTGPSDRSAPGAAASASTTPSSTEPAATENVRPGPEASASADVLARELTVLERRLDFLRAKPAPTVEDRAEMRALTEQIALLQGTTTPDLLPGVDLLTEEVEPGVYRVVSDGVRDLDLAAHPGEYGVWPVADGSVWMSRPEGIFRLGDPESLSVPGRLRLSLADI